MKYSYYPGCSLHSTAKEYNLSIHAVSSALGLELEEIPGWFCCGATPAHQTEELLALALSAKNLLLAKNGEVAVACAACFNSLCTANFLLSKDESLRGKVKKVLGEEYSGEVKVKHFLDILIRDVGIGRLSEKATKGLNGLKIASYYGCLLTRPPKVMSFDDPEDPQSMDEIIAALKGEPLFWSHKTECCGASLSLPKTDIVLKLGYYILSAARRAGAQCIAVACPMCQGNLDLRQKQIEKTFNVTYKIPILYITQLIGLAFGIGEKELGLNMHSVDPRPLLKEMGLI